MTTDQPASAAIPMLSYEDPARAADWVAEAFGFRETAAGAKRMVASRTSTWNATAPSSCSAPPVATTRTRATTPRSATTLVLG
jgi:hypothetical protein